MKRPGFRSDNHPKIAVDPGQSDDELMRVVSQILHTLRSGRSAIIPGLGTIRPGKQWTFLPESNAK